IGPTFDMYIKKIVNFLENNPTVKVLYFQNEVEIEDCVIDDRFHVVTENSLAGQINKIKEIKPKFHISGHIHEGYGIYQDENTTYINAALHDDFYELVNKPVEIYYD
ncbi:hypothetical protein LCGC14_1583840, partial [marine sediment metagenome]